MDLYVALALKSIETFLKTGKKPDLPVDLPFELIKAKAGVFVTLHQKSSHELRGCIGTFLPTKENVAEEIVSNAISAATEDPRFPPVTQKELDDQEINVDVLSEPEPIESPRQLDIKKYGVIVRGNYNRCGLLLPDIDGVSSVDEQINIACQKAGLNRKEKIALFRFTVKRHK